MAKPFAGEFGSVSVPDVFRRLVLRKTDGGRKKEQAHVSI